jgi:hypothetical protein
MVVEIRNLTRKATQAYEDIIMESMHVSKSELKKLIEEAMINVLIERKDLLEDAVAEAIIDMNLALSIEAGDTGEYVSEKEILAKLRD